MKPDLWAVIPVKPFELGKSRLAGMLDTPRRTALNRKLFDHVFGTAVAGNHAGGFDHHLHLLPHVRLDGRSIHEGKRPQ